MKTLILGLGNPILGDDGAGWRVVESVSQQLAGKPDVEADFVSLGGLNLMERLTGYERVILVDSIFTKQKPIGTVSRFALSDMPDLTAGHSASAHDTSLHTALTAGRNMSIPLPSDEDIFIVAIEAENVYDFSESLSPKVSEAIPRATEAVLKLIPS
jgi:hydrogenase maturation protease